MTRRARGGLIATAVSAAVAIAFTLGGGALRSVDSGVPLLTVEAETFFRRIMAEGNLKAARATPVIVPTEVWGAVRLAWMIPEGEAVAAGEVVARLDPTDLERSYLDAVDQRATADLQLAKAAAHAQSASRNLERDADLASLELDHVRSFQRRDELVFSRLEILESEVDEELARQRREHVEAEREIRRTLTRTEHELLDVERRRADIALERATTGLGLLEIAVPHAGFLIRERNWRGEPVRVGDTVFRGQKLGELPDLSTLEAEVWVLEADAGGLAPGQRARVVVESRPGESFEGVVARVEGVAKPRVPASPVQYFAVTLALPESADAGLKPGQRVRAEILLDERQEALVVPRQAVFELEGVSIVYRLGREGFEARPVTLGAAGAGRVVVAAGLEAGDRIALRDPGQLVQETEARASGPSVAGGS